MDDIDSLYPVLEPTPELQADDPNYDPSGDSLSLDAAGRMEGRREEAMRAVSEAGGGESEGFELAEQELIEHASHGDDRSTFPIIRDSEGIVEKETSDAEYGEADEENIPD